MKTYKLIAAAAAVLLTFASLRAVLYDVNVWQPTSSHTTATIHVTDLAPVVVHPSATQRREAALLNGTASLGLITLPVSSENAPAASIQPLNLLGSQLVMPYYSFGKKSGRITKE